MYWQLPINVDKSNFSPDGKWMWNGTDWIPAPPNSSPSKNEGQLISKTNTAINMQDSVIGGDVTIHQSNASEIAEAVNAGRVCMKCNSLSNNMYSCESTDCDLAFCFACMQKYIHGHRIIDYKLCQNHYYAEEKGIELDVEFGNWQNKISSLIKSEYEYLVDRLEKEIHSSNNPDEAINTSSNMKTGGLGLAITGIIILFVSIAANLGDLTGVGAAGIVLGLLIFAGSFAVVPCTEEDIRNTREEIKDSKGKINLLIKDNLQYSYDERPKIVNRHTPEIDNLAIIKFISGNT